MTMSKKILKRKMNFLYLDLLFSICMRFLKILFLLSCNESLVTLLSKGYETRPFKLDNVRFTKAFDLLKFIKVYSY